MAAGYLPYNIFEKCLPFSNLSSELAETKESALLQSFMLAYTDFNNCLRLKLPQLLQDQGTRSHSENHGLLPIFKTTTELGRGMDQSKQNTKRLS